MLVSTSTTTVSYLISSLQKGDINEDDIAGNLAFLETGLAHLANVGYVSAMCRLSLDLPRATSPEPFVTVQYYRWYGIDYQAQESATLRVRVLLLRGVSRELASVVRPRNANILQGRNCTYGLFLVYSDAHPLQQLPVDRGWVIM
jgi:hypothetical protein